MSTKTTTLLWLRRDLRLHDHAALAKALEYPNLIQPIFIFDTVILKRFINPADRRLSFIADTLVQLHAQLQKKGGGLLVFHGNPIDIMPRLIKALDSSHIVAAQDYEPATMQRDDRVSKAISNLILVKDHLLLAPDELTRQGQPYKVYTPYANVWRGRVTPHDAIPYACHDKGRYADYGTTVKQIEKADLTPINPAHGAAAILKAIGYRHVSLGEWTVHDAQKRLTDFIGDKVTAYASQRDQLAVEGTSKLSPYLRFGLVSVRECYRLAYDAHGAQKWINELIWREFYAMILYHFPDSATKEWNPLYRSLDWSYDEEKLQAWKDGKTGYPVIDAAMRQLTSIGWMHNRARMIVASFLTKDLMIDWRLGEEHFAQYLMDYELASNVGGWQWAASTGTDAQPYFRVFNPYLQSEKYDPNGDYIRHYVPELSHLSRNDIHNPPPLLRPKEYPAPIVDHDAARKSAIALFKAARAS